MRERQAEQMQQFLDQERQKIEDALIFEASLGRHNRLYDAFTMKKVRCLPIVGDVHLAREQWPSSPQDWRNLWSIRPLAVKLDKIVYSVNKREKAFNAISLRFLNQNFKSYDLSCTSQTKRITLHVKQRQAIQTVRIKQRNNPDGVSQICGLHLIDKVGSDAALIDLCPDLGQWRVQHLEPDEHIIGLHCYNVADDESEASIVSARPTLPDEG